jgi:hypothetical protein
VTTRTTSFDVPPDDGFVQEVVLAWWCFRLSQFGQLLHPLSEHEQVPGHRRRLTVIADSRAYSAVWSRPGTTVLGNWRMKVASAS